MDQVQVTPNSSKCTDPDCTH